MKPKLLAEEGKVRLLLIKPGCHQRVTLVGSCYKVPSRRSMSKQEMDISKRERFTQLGKFSQLLHNLLNDYCK